MENARPVLEVADDGPPAENGLTTALHRFVILGVIGYLGWASGACPTAP
jgi:hypothetical protein